MVKARFLNGDEALSFCRSSPRLIALLEPAAWPGLDHDLSRYELEFLLLYPKTPPGDLVPHLPRVVHIPNEHEFLDVLFKRYGGGHGILLGCAEGLQLVDLARAEARLCGMVLPSRKKGWLRFYDPYVLRVLLESGPPEQTANFFAPGVDFYLAEYPQTASWAFFERSASGADGVKPLNPPLHLSPQQVEALGEGQRQLFLYELTSYCLKKYFADRTEEERGEAARQIAGHAEIAEEEGFISMLHRRKFVELACVQGWSFYNRPEYREVLLKSCRAPENKMRALEDVARNREV